MYRNLEILGEARVGMQNCRFCWTASAKVIMCAYWRLGAFPCSSNPVFLKLLVLLFRLLSAQTPKFPWAEQCSSVLGSAPWQGWLLGSWQPCWGSALHCSWAGRSAGPFEHLPPLCRAAAFPSLAQLLSRSKLSCLRREGWESRKSIIAQLWEFMGCWYLCAGQWSPDVTHSFENPNLCDARIANN